MTLSDVMDGLADLTGMDNAYAWPAENISVPCAVVGFPTHVEFDLVYGRGADTFQLPVWLVVGKSGTIDSRNRLSEKLTGVASIKEQLDGSHDFGSVRCTDAEVAELSVAGTPYVAIKFNVEVIG